MDCGNTDSRPNRIPYFEELGNSISRCNLSQLTQKAVRDDAAKVSNMEILQP